MFFREKLNDEKRIYAMDVSVSCDSLFIREGFREGMALGSEPDWRLADDGKRIQCDGRCTYMRKPSYRVGVREGRTVR